MSTLSSASTLAQVKQSYDDNASYQEDASPTKCRAFCTACTILLRRLPAEAGKGQTTLKIDLGQVKAELEQARAWLSPALANAPGGGVRFSDSTNFRS